MIAYNADGEAVLVGTSASDSAVLFINWDAYISVPPTHKKEWDECPGD